MSQTDVRLKRSRGGAWLSVLVLVGCGGTEIRGDIIGAGAPSAAGGERALAGGREVVSSGGGRSEGGKGGDRADGGGSRSDGGGGTWTGGANPGGSTAGGDGGEPGGEAQICVDALHPLTVSNTGCTYPMPAPSIDRPVNFKEGTRLTYYPGATDMGSVSFYPRWDNQTDPDCAEPGTNGEVGTGWYYSGWDEVGDPLKLTLCPDTCATVRTDPNATLEITFECLCAC